MIEKQMKQDFPLQTLVELPTLRCFHFRLPAKISHIIYIDFFSICLILSHVEEITRPKDSCSFGFTDSSGNLSLTFTCLKLDTSVAYLAQFTMMF